MALFKIEKGQSGNLAKNRPNTIEGYCYFTTDDGKFYIDIATGTGTTNRVCLNAAQADQLRTARTITLTGDAAGAFQFDGSGDVTVEVTIAELDEINTAVSGKAPKSHASSSTTYGKGTSSKYGHVKLSDAVDSTSAASGGIAATPQAVKTAYDLANTTNTTANNNVTRLGVLEEDIKEIATKAPINHASSETTYGVGSDANYGHLKLSAATNGTSGVNGGIAATPSAVKSAYDLANTANTTANTANSQANTNKTSIGELTTSVNSLGTSKAPNNHAVNTTTYGLGTNAVYGHVKLSDSTNSTSSTSAGIAATPAAVRAAYNLANTANTQAGTNKTDITQLKEDVKGISTKAPINHASIETTYGVGNDESYGHLKLSDATALTTSDVDGGIAATPKAVASAYSLANTANNTANNANSQANTNKTSIGELTTSVNSLSTGKAPNNHASANTTYGVGTNSAYGHLKLSDATNSTNSTSNGTAATPKAVKTAYDLANGANTQAGTNKTDIAQLKEDIKEIATKAPINHASSETTYGIGTGSNYGHVKLSDSVASTSAASAGIAASPKAVKTAYDKAASAASAANTNAGEITTLKGTVNDTLVPTVNNHSNKLQYTNITYGTCATAAETAEKVIELDVNAKWELKKGSFITILFDETNTAENPTFNVGNTGAKNVYYTTSQITTKSLSYAGRAGRPMNFVFDGTQYRFAGWGADADTNTKVTQNRNTSSNTYPVLLKYNTTTDDGTSSVKFNENINVTPSTGTLSATKFVGELDGKATTAGTADKVANALTLKGNGTTAGTFNGSTATSVNIIGAGSTTVSGASGTITITGATIPTSLKNPKSLTIGSVEYDGSAAATVESLKNPNSLTIQGNGTTLTNGTYDGSTAKTVNITPASIGALAVGGTAVKATADANGNNIVNTYDTKTSVNSKVAEALNTAKDYTDTEIASLINGAPEHLDTLKELADVLGADANLSSTIIELIGEKSDKGHTHTDAEIYRSNWPTSNIITGSTLAEMLEDIEGHIDDTIEHIGNTTVHITAAERTKWNKAQANQNAFSNITIGSTTVAADSATDTVTFAGSNITITPDATNDKITFAVADGTTSAKGIVKLEDSVSSTSTSTAATPNSVRAAYVLANGKAPINHASTATTYGAGSGDDYGHLKLSAATNSTSGINGGIAATPSAVKIAYDLANTANTTANTANTQAGTNKTKIEELTSSINTLNTNKAPNKHAIDTDTYGLGTSSLYGHVKLSDATNSTSTASAGIAATPKAVASAYSLANTANNTANSANSQANTNKASITELNTAVNGRAPTKHAVDADTHGLGTSSLYGHVKLSDSTSSTSAASAGIAATPKAVKTAYDLANSANTKAGTNANDIIQLKEDVEGIATKADKKHDSTTPDFGIGTSSAYGHVKLSDSTSSTSAASAGIAASPKAVKSAYDLANTANTTANANSGKITTLQSTVNDTLVPTVNNHSNKLQYTNITYGTCSTAAENPAKVIEIDSNSKWELKKGSTITVLFSETNTAENPTFNVGDTGVKNIYYEDGQITTSSLSRAGYKDRPMTFVYDGDQYRFISWGYDGNTNTYVTQTATTSTSSYPILIKNSANSTKETKGVKFSSEVTITPSTGTLTATTFSGDLSGKATTAGTADKVANALTLKGNGTTAGTFNGSTATSVNIIGAGSTTVSGASGTITITGATIPTKLPNAYSLTIGSVEYDGSQAQTVESLKNPYSLTIQGNGTTLTNGTYDGSAAKTINITPDSIGALASGGTAVKATADANGNNIVNTYETKANVTTKISDAINTTKDYTDTEIASLINGAPEHLNTLKELADVLGADENMSATIVEMIGGKADKVHTHKDSEITRSSSWSPAKITGDTLDTMLSSIDTHMGDAVNHIQDTTVHITAAERAAWNKAEVNQNAFSNIAVSGQTTVAANAKADTVTFAGSNITITTDATNDKITFKVASASTSTAGIVKLEDSRSSTSTTTAATPNSVKVAYDLANGANELANDLNEDVAQLQEDVQTASEHVKQGLSEASNYRPLLMHGVNGGTSAGADPGIITDQVFYNPQIYACPANGELYATTFVGDLDGNAATSSGWKSAVTINGSTIQGPDTNTSAITTTKWGAARNINIVSSDGTGGSTAVSVDGSNTSGYSLKLPATIKASLTGNVTGNLTGNVTGNVSGSSGSCTGNAATATKATQDGSGNTITSTYLKLSGGTMSGNIKMGYSSKGYYLMDNTGYNYPGIYDNGSNLWIGSTATASTHHTGNTYISAGHNGTTGNGTIYVSVPNDANDGGTNYKVVHEGNYTSYQVDQKVKQGRSTASSWRPLLSHYTYAAAGTDPGTATDQVYYNENVAVQYSTGTLSATKVKGAVWNDYAEYRTYKDSDKIPYGRIVVENGDDTLSLSNERLQKGGNVCSDTFGFSIGETDKAQMPIAVSGRALVYTYEDRNSYEPGDAVCTGPNGTISKMTREEIKEYPDCIVGYVSAIPTYETWGHNNSIVVDNRIWIKVV